MFARETQLFHIFVKGTEHESTRAFTKEEPHLNQFTNILNVTSIVSFSAWNL